MRARLRLASAVLFVVALLATPAWAESFFFSTGNPDGLMATASRPSFGDKIEIESADDFILKSQTQITGGSFTGLLANGASLSDIKDVRVEIYRVFPADSKVDRTSGEPTFSTSNVPTRVNSPSDVALDERSVSAGNLASVAAITSQNFTAAKSVLNGIPIPFVKSTGGEGSVTGQEVRFNLNLNPSINPSLKPFLLDAGHYFFVPQVQLSSGDFFWLSAPKPIVPAPPGFSPDLQEWIRNEKLAPDWLRVGTDIVGGNPAPTFNATFSLSGEIVPEPASLTMLALGAAAVFAAARALRRSHPASHSVACK